MVLTLGSDYLYEMLSFTGCIEVDTEINLADTPQDNLFTNS